MSEILKTRKTRYPVPVWNQINAVPGTRNYGHQINAVPGTRNYGHQINAVPGTRNYGNIDRRSFDSSYRPVIRLHSARRPLFVDGGLPQTSRVAEG